MKINFDLNGNPESPTFILAKHNGDLLGKIDAYDITAKDNFTDVPEINFICHKYINDKLNPLWNDMKSFRRIWWKEQNRWFELTINLSLSTSTSLSCTGTDLGKSELSNIYLFGVAINTDEDIARDDYDKPTIIYDEENKEASLFHRILKDANNYKIDHVDSTIAKLQRTFTFDNVSIWDAFNQIEQEINCKVIVVCKLDEKGKIVRNISVYDMEQNCKACGYRGEFTDICPKCGSHDYIDCYGQDTTILIDELADTIQLTPDTDSLKNCFKLEAGDDLMTATVINCNPNGSDRIWNISDDMKEDMSDELKEKLSLYDDLYNEYQTTHKFNINSNIISKYNNIIKKYQQYRDDLKEISSPITGYAELMTAYYDTIDLALYLQSSLMPTFKMSDTTAQKEANKLTAVAISPVSVSMDGDNLSLATSDSVVLSVAKIVVDTRYKVKVNTSSLTKIANGWDWTGNFTVTNYSDDEDIANSQMIDIFIDKNYENFVRQKIEKALKKDDDKDYSISGIFKLSEEDFKKEMKKYSLVSLTTFHDACQACIDILIDQGISDSKTWDGRDPNLYNNLYKPYYLKLKAIEEETSIREDEINAIIGKTDETGEVIQNGLQNEIIAEKNKTQDVLNFEKYLGEDLWSELNSYRRETSYSNSNYISDGLTNNEIFEKAREFLEAASKELYKSSHLQYSITVDNLKNLFAIKKYEPLRDSFQVGNWIRSKIDEKIYKLRLLSYQINFKDFTRLSSVQFSNVKRIKDGISDVRDVLSRASSIAKSYDGVYHQMNKNKKTNNIIDNWFENGLSTANTKIISESDGQEQIWDNHGMLFQKRDSITGEYNPKKMKIINSSIVLTTDDFETTRTAFGNFIYQDPKTGEYTDAYGINGEMIVGKLLIGEQLKLYNDKNTLLFDENGLEVSNDITSITISPNASSLLSLVKKADKSNLMAITKDGNLAIVGDITARSLTLLDGTTIDGNRVSGLSTVAMSGKYSDLTDAPKLESYMQKDSTIGQNPSDGATGFTVSSSGLLRASNAVIYGTLYSSAGKIAGWDIGNGYLRFKDSSNYYSGIGASGITYAFYAGGTKNDGSDAKFKVEHSGRMYASNVDISGNIVAQNCKVENSLYFYANEYGTDSYGKMMYLEQDEGKGSSNTYMNLVLGKAYGDHLAENSTIAKNVNFGNVVIPSSLLLGINKIDVASKISALETKITTLENKIKELEG